MNKIKTGTCAVCGRPIEHTDGKWKHSDSRYHLHRATPAIEKPEEEDDAAPPMPTDGPSFVPDGFVGVGLAANLLDSPAEPERVDNEETKPSTTWNEPEPSAPIELEAPEPSFDSSSDSGSSSDSSSSDSSSSDSSSSDSSSCDCSPSTDP